MDVIKEQLVKDMASLRKQVEELAKAVAEHTHTTPAPAPVPSIWAKKKK
jgi:hypothetical protein